MEQEESIHMIKNDLDQIISAITNNRKLPKKALLYLCECALEQLQNQDKLINLKSPVTVVGDLNGQFQDLQEIFQIGGRVPDTNYLFLGNYINKGHYSIECFSYLIALKLRYPSRITLLRGSHETTSTSKIYGFYDECNNKYGSIDIWKAFLSVFECLPLSAVIENEVFCVHAGLSHQINDISQILNVKDDESSLVQQGPAYHLLWNEPEESEGQWTFSESISQIYFGKQVTKKFLHKNNLKLILRAHEYQKNGYNFMHDKKLCSIFSAPNQDASSKSLGSFVEFDDQMDMNIQQFQPILNKQQYNQHIQDKRINSILLDQDYCMNLE
ncbi:ser/thr phosphatase family protein (macronuclear) [Tetrahymena thermophila SB210]|uniref:protein-serine/threonine phosphatase n=1 Tax=Tetrahymena thermophila (strain SB210) TaxID=312017 RepID=I7M461_TETTS|nr:ser/thr phosphatase family protein [Tetrahymena thermophila SB210]EAS04969.2 ser/thr phosphatase family protein [Tetrahymena thermophila SB210]|eukprot:XP_001025214.2 ser/thr phosphatase family protein [Tetrahymena thermophila SB210]